MRTMLCAAVFALLFFQPLAGSPDSEKQLTPIYTLDRVSATAIGQTASSSSYTATVVAGETFPSGRSSFCNAGYVCHTGFLSVLGQFTELAVPIQLRLARNPVDPATVNLTWTGADSSFGVYRSGSPENIIDPVNHYAETPLCHESDSQGAGDITFYLIVGRD